MSRKYQISGVGLLGQSSGDDSAQITLQNLGAESQRNRISNNKFIIDDFEKIINHIPDFALRLFVRNKLIAKNLGEDAGENPQLRKIRDDVLTCELNERKIIDFMGVFSAHPNFRKRNGAVRECFLPEGEFVRYIISKIPQNRADQESQQIFRSFLYNIFEVFCEAAKAKHQEKMEDFFVEYPPVGADLLCEGGTSSRGENILQKLKCGSENKYFLAAHDQAFVALSQKVAFTAHRGNYIHIPRYLEWILSIKSEDEIRALDPNYNTLSTSTSSAVVLECCKQYSQLFKENLVKILDLKAVRNDIAYEIDLFIKTLNAKKNKEAQFLNGEPHILQGFGTAEEGAAVLKINQEIRRQFSLPDDFQALSYDNYDDSTVVLFHKDRLIEKILQARLRFMSAELSKISREGAAADIEGDSFSIFSEKSLPAIREKLESFDHQKVLEALEAIFSLSFPSAGSADHWFLRLVIESAIINAKDYIQTILPEHFWKITRIEERFQSLSEALPLWFSEIIENQDRVLNPENHGFGSHTQEDIYKQTSMMPYIFCSGSTEDIVGLIKQRSRTTWRIYLITGQLVNALNYGLSLAGKDERTVPSNLGFGFKYEQIFSSICLRQDALEIIKAFSQVMRLEGREIIPLEARFLLLSNSFKYDLREVWQELLSNDIAGDFTYDYFRAILPIAAQKKSHEVIKALLASILDDNSKIRLLFSKDQLDLNSKSAMDYIGINGDLESLDAILQSHLNRCNNIILISSRIIEFATIHGRHEMIKMILESGHFTDVDINYFFLKSETESIPYLAAERKESFPILELILNSARITQENKIYLLNRVYPFLSKAASFGSGGAIKILFSNANIPPAQKLRMAQALTLDNAETFLDIAALKGRRQTVLEILDEDNPLAMPRGVRKFLLNHRNQEGQNFLALAPFSKNGQILIAVLESDCLSSDEKESLLKQLDNKGQSVLHQIVKFGENLEALDFILGRARISPALKKFLLKTKDNKGNTVLHIASFFGNPAIFSSILKHAENFGLKEYLINERNKNGSNFFHEMSYGGYNNPKSAIFKAVIAGDDIPKAAINRLLRETEAKSLGKTVLNINARRFDEESILTIKFILESPDVTAETKAFLLEYQNFFGTSVIDKVMRPNLGELSEHRLNIAKYLMEQGAYLPSTTNNAHRLRSIKQKMDQIAEFIKTYDSAIDLFRHIGLYENHDYKAELNSRNKDGFNAMHLAALNPALGFAEIDYLISIGGRCDICTKDQINFADLALRAKNYGALARAIEFFDTDIVITKAIEGAQDSLRPLLGEFYQNLKPDLQIKFNQKFSQWFERKAASLDSVKLVTIANAFAVDLGSFQPQANPARRFNRFGFSEVEAQGQEKLSLIQRIKDKLTRPVTRQAFAEQASGPDFHPTASRHLGGPNAALGPTRSREL